MDEFENVFQLAGYTVTDALNDLLETGQSDLLAFFLDGDDDEAELVIQSIQLQPDIERSAEIMRENWPKAIMGVMINPAEDEFGQRCLNVWAFGYEDEIEARMSLAYLADETGVLVHEVESQIMMKQNSAPDIFAHVAFLDFMNGAQAHDASAKIWPPSVVERLIDNTSIS